MASIRRSILERWGDQADSTLPTQLFWLTPTPPSALTQSAIGHVLVVQGLIRLRPSLPPEFVTKKDKPFIM